MLISTLLKDKSFNPKITKGILYNMIPFRSSIEIECITSLSRVLNVDTLGHSKYPYNQIMTKKYDIYDYRDDRNRLQSKSICEHRISIRNYSQAAGLYKILQDMQKYCKLNPKSGIHLHIDAPKIANYAFIALNNNQDRLNYFLRKKLDILEEIFGEYNGKINSKRIGYEDKHSWINIRYDSKHSLEFRIAPMTFDYETIILWIVKCNQIVKQLHKKLKISYK